MNALPSYVIHLCFVATAFSVSISTVCILMHLKNYRKPLQQRLIARILLIIPIYASICYINLVSSRWVSALVEPIKEIYEAFVLYVFYCLLTDLLGGERSIIVMTSRRAPVSHPFPFNYIAQPVDISDPETFLFIKRSILQYVWLKPFLCLLFAVNEIVHTSERTVLVSLGFWTNLVYNISVSMSLYSLALFWKCLYEDLKQFNPWGKFLCVKLIIFASYWQGILLAILNYFNYLRESSFEIQNALLCFELIGFAIGHWTSFNYKEFTIRYLNNSARLPITYAIADVFGYADLIYDFNITFRKGGQRYNFRNFQSVDVESQVSQYDGQTRLKKLNQGLRYYNLQDGTKGTYWIDENKRNDDESVYSYDDDDLRTITSDSKSLKKITNENSKKPLKSHPFSKKTSQINKKLRSLLANEKQVAAIKTATKQLYKLNSLSTEHLLVDIGLPKDEFLQDNALYIRAIRKKPFGDDNYPVIYDKIGYIYSQDLRKRRLEALSRSLHSGPSYGSINNGKTNDKMIGKTDDSMNGSSSSNVESSTSFYQV